MKLTFFGTSHGAPEVGRFCSGTLLETDGVSYLVDCGAPVDALMLNRGKRFEDLRGIFITHMHEDHMGTLPAVLKEFGHYHPTAHGTFYLPEDGAIEAFLAWDRAMHGGYDANRVSFATVKPGVIHDDEHVTVTAYLTEHIRPFPSYAYDFYCKTEDKHVLFTGDLRGDLSDFPKTAQDMHRTAIVSELTHFHVEQHVDTFAACDCDVLIFNHMIGYNTEKMPDIIPTLPMAVHVAADGDEVVL